MIIREVSNNNYQSLKILKKAFDDFYESHMGTWESKQKFHKKELKEFQIEVCCELEEQFSCNSNCLLHLDTGLGKTFITLTYIAANRKVFLDGKTPILIIAPASNLQDPWIQEIKSLHFNYYVYRGIEKDILVMDKMLRLEGFDFVLISYQTLESKNCNEYFFKTNFNLIIYDEPQTIINPIKLTNTLCKLQSVKGFKRLALTASPLSNSENELYILSVLLSNPEKISEAYENLKIIRNKSELVKIAKQNIPIISKSKFNKNINSQMNLQPLREYKVILPVHHILKEKLKELSSTAQRSLLLEIPEDFIPSVSEYINFDNFDCKTKAVELILSLVPTDQKIIIFSMYTNYLEKLYKKLSKNYTCFVVKGGMTTKARTSTIEKFKSYSKKAVMLASLKANTTGLNYQEANNEIFVDSWYNPEVMKQARDRCFRMGQEKTTTVFYLTTDTEHENNIHKIKDSKSEIKANTFSIEIEDKPQSNYSPPKSQSKNLVSQ